VDAYADVVGMSAEAVFGDADEGKAWGADENEKKRREREPAECIVDIREHDIAYYLRVAIDLGKLIRA
jgi:DNA polymerase epsilon subunit 1